MEKEGKWIDRHVLELRHVCQPGLPLCQNLVVLTLHIQNLDNLGRQIEVTTIKLDPSFKHTFTHSNHWF